MTGFIAALALFGAIAAIVAAARADDTAVQQLGQGPHRAPKPGPRDMHAVTGSLGRAHVPSWG